MFDRGINKGAGGRKLEFHFCRGRDVPARALPRERWM
jgi:hypothetical protein